MDKHLFNNRKFKDVSKKIQFQADYRKYKAKSFVRSTSRKINELPAIQKVANWFKKVMARWFGKKQTLHADWNYKPIRNKSRFGYLYINGSSFKATKSYADQRQKTSQNRKKKASKRIRHLYKHVGRYQ